MKRINLKKVLFVAAYFLFLCLLLPLQFDDVRLDIFLYPIIATSVMFLFYRYVPGGGKARKPVIIVVGIVYILFMFPALMELTFCGWERSWRLYVNKSNPSVSIVTMRHACIVAIDEPEVFKERSITKHIKWITAFDDRAAIDSTEWEKVGR